MRDIETCRTAVLGGHLDVCDACGDARPAYNSCRNRHCPKCQCLRQAKWIADRMERVLPTHYFHVVFTVPAELQAPGPAQQDRFFELLFAAASRTLLELGRDPERSAPSSASPPCCTPGRASLASTPTSTASSPAAASRPTAALDLGQGRRPLPVPRQRHLARSSAASSSPRSPAPASCGQLDFDGACADLADPAAFARLKDALYKKDWVVYSKPPFGGAEQVFHYLGRYTHRVGISNQRLRGFDERGVTFATKDGAAVTLAPDEFIRRFLQHVLPRGFVKIRHFGLLAPGNVNGKLARGAPPARPCSRPARSARRCSRYRRPRHARRQHRRAAAGSRLAGSLPPAHRHRPRTLPRLRPGQRRSLSSAGGPVATARLLARCGFRTIVNAGIGAS